VEKLGFERLQQEVKAESSANEALIGMVVDEIDETKKVVVVLQGQLGRLVLSCVVK